VVLGRTMEPLIGEMSAGFPVVLLTGARQVGKTTLLTLAMKREALKTGKKPRNYVSLDNLDDREAAKNAPALFLERYKPPVIIDEIQYAPELFPAIKAYIDAAARDKIINEGAETGVETEAGIENDGLFWLTGSQKFNLMSGIKESLAGRAAILELFGLSYREISGKPFNAMPFIPDWALLDDEFEPLSLDAMFNIIWRGAFPRLAASKNVNRQVFFGSYLQTYLERDIRGELGLKNNELKFHNFIRAAAVRTGTLLNYADMARDAQIDQRTAKVWLAALERAGLVQLLEPYYRNPLGRLIHTPKLYFLDTGLCSYLAAMNSPSALEASYLNGRIFETWVFAEILKSYRHSGEAANIYFYRDADRREIDFVIESNGTLYPVEVKKTVSPCKDDAKHFKTLEVFKQPVGTGAVICLRPSPLALTDKIIALPAWGI